MAPTFVQLPGDVVQAQTQGPQLQFKEMAFAQGHRTYVALLGSLQHARKQMHLNKQSSKHLPGLNLYPKPPRHSYPFDGISYRLTPGSDMPAGRNSLPASGHISPFGTGSGNIEQEAHSALDVLRQMAIQSGWTWIEGILLAGSLAYGLNRMQEAEQMWQKVLNREPTHVEAMSNLAATYMAQRNYKEAELMWTEAVKLRPGWFEAVEHLVGLLCVQSRSGDAIHVIQHVEKSLRVQRTADAPPQVGPMSNYIDPGKFVGWSGSGIMPHSGYRTPAVENGRLIALIHAKGNMLYAMGNILGAAQAFEEAIMIAVGKTVDGISGLIRRILGAFSEHIRSYRHEAGSISQWETILLLPRTAVKTTSLAFPSSKPLPGLDDIFEGSPKKAAIAVTSNCLLSLAKIYQDSMSSGGTALGPSGAAGVHDILALYYLSLSLQPSPSTANNVGILLAGVQQSVSSRLPPHLLDKETPTVAGVVPGTGVALALAYYNYGLLLDKEHAHLFTNLGSLLKDLGQLDMAIRMYEEAVRCGRVVAV